MSQNEFVNGLVEAGVHFGHRSSKWNPRMKPYISGKRNNIHIIDIRETVKGVLLAKRLVTQLVAGGKDIVFVGTKRQAKHAVEAEAKRAGMHYVTERWLGGTLTNFTTIRKRVARLAELERIFGSEEIDGYSKKMKSTLSRELKKIKANLEGIRNLDKIPAAVVVFDTRREHNAIREAKKMGVMTIALIDTDCDPTLIDLPIPGNDDSMRAIEVIMKELAEAAIAGKGAREDKGEDATQARARTTRAKFRADEPAAAPATPAAPAAEPAAPEAKD